MAQAHAPVQELRVSESNRTGVIVAGVCGVAWLVLMAALGAAFAARYGPYAAVGAPLVLHALLATGFVSGALLTGRRKTPR